MAQISPEETIGAFLRAHQFVWSRLQRMAEDADAPDVLQSVVLTRLYRAPMRRAGMQELGEMLAMSPSGVCRLVDRMEAAGYVSRERSVEDRRVTYTVLTEAGEQALRYTGDVYRAGYEELFLKRLTPAQLDTLVALLSEIAPQAGETQLVAESTQA
jgi:DNA-binding MarR family transcriptional regulator